MRARVERRWWAAIAAMVVACGQSPARDRPVATGDRLPTPPVLRQGEAWYLAHCAACHGPGGTGTEQGPPLVHPVYAPRHHADAAFVLAATAGVRAHHWRFGDMPPVPAVSRAQVTAIVRYVRWLQRVSGIS